MARKTECLTPGCMFHTRINSKGVSIRVDFPQQIHFTRKEAKLLEDLLHNSVETVLRPYFRVSKRSKRVMLKQAIKTVGGLYGKVRT
tara:strand:- start:130 stop:390 length:261 start_codon:yes stop_codon:yes gene_type:complete